MNHFFLLNSGTFCCRCGIVAKAKRQSQITSRSQWHAGFDSRRTSAFAPLCQGRANLRFIGAAIQSGAILWIGFGGAQHGRCIVLGWLDDGLWTVQAIVQFSCTERIVFCKQKPNQPTKRNQQFPPIPTNAPYIRANLTPIQVYPFIQHIKEYISNVFGFKSSKCF